jgi:hypothetical protein
MDHPSADGLSTQRSGPTADTARMQRGILREALDYQGERSVLGRTFLEEPLSQREAHLWTLEDGEHLVLLLQHHRYCHWEPSREPLKTLHRRACDWLTEPEPQDP